MAYNLEAALHVLQTGGERVTSKYGTRTITIGGKVSTHFHSGIDLVQRTSGTDAIIAAARGVVTAARNTIQGYSETYSSGNYVHLDHGNGVVTEYKHMKLGSVCVAVGETVEKGQVLGYMGSTGWSTGNHLHFGIRISGDTTDPEPYLLGKQNLYNYEGGSVTMDEQAFKLERVPLYAASTSQKASGTVTGTYWLWSNGTVQGRYRITNRAENIGKAGQVTGWVDVSYIKREEQESAPEQPDESAELAAYRNAIEIIRSTIEGL